MQRIGSPFLPAILWLIIATILLTLPGSAIPKEDWLDKIWFDKWAHTGMFFIMVFLWSRAMSKKNRHSEVKKRAIIKITIAALLYGIGMEFVQKYFIGNRSFDIGDIAADAAGCGIGLIYSLRRFTKK